MAFVLAIAQAFRHTGRDPLPLLQQAQIAPHEVENPAARVTAWQFERLSGLAMQALDDEALGWFRRRLPWGSYGMLARASISSPTLGVALRRWCRHHGLLTEDVRLALEVAGPSARIAIEERRPIPREVRELSLAFLLRNVHGLACWYIDSRIPLLAAAFPYPAPPHAAAYAHMFPAPLSFDAEQAQIRFDAQYLTLPLRRDEKALAQMLPRALSITVRQYRRDRLLVPQVRQALAAHPERSHSAEALAALLHVSPRTLHRQLKEEGASLQQLKDEVRLERAKDLLYRTDKPVKQVAAAVGFRNEKSFSRAFRLWTGLSPAALRNAE